MKPSLGRNGPVSVLVKESEGLLELCCLLVSEMFSHLKRDYWIIPGLILVNQFSIVGHHGATFPVFPSLLS